MDQKLKSGVTRTHFRPRASGLPNGWIDPSGGSTVPASPASHQPFQEPSATTQPQGQRASFLLPEYRGLAILILLWAVIFIGGGALLTLSLLT